LRPIEDFVLDFMVNALWQPVLLAAIAVLCLRLLLRRASAQHHYVVWVAALILSVLLPFWSALPKRIDPLKPAILPIAINLSTLRMSPALQAIPPTTGTSSVNYSSTLRNLPVKSIFTGLFLLFILYRLLKLGRAWSATRAIRKSAIPVVISERLEKAMNHCRQALGVGDVSLLCSPSVMVPVTLGLRRPAIILPAQLASGASPELLTAALGHEMTHIRRRDYAWNILFELLFLPISFHPAAALVKRRINETRELACDETVGELVMDAHDYARSLVGLANSVSLSSRPTYILGVDDADILERRIMKLVEKMPSASKRSARVWLAIALFALTLSGAGAAAFPVNIMQNQNNQIAAAKLFVSTWKGKLNHEDVADKVMSFKMKGNRLTGTQRASLIRPSQNTDKKDKKVEQQERTGPKSAEQEIAEQEIIALENEITDLTKLTDTAALQHILSDDFTFIGGFGRFRDRANYLEMISRIVYESYVKDEVTVRVYGNTAVTTGRITEKARRKDGQEIIDYQYRFTNMYAKQNDRWRQVAMQLTSVAQR
jgi:beta-lactamase regulating signal transducer with metallopeptidase domain/ketosteroid isomerase-like protein